MYSALAVTSLAAAGIHFAVIGDHFKEYFVFGLFFSVVAWLQALWALGVVVAPTRRLLIGGLVGNTVVVAVWVVSRTIGVPIGPDPGTPEPVTFLDGLSTVLEIGIIGVTTALLLRRRSPQEARSGRAASRMVVGLGLALMLLTTVAVASGGGHQEHGRAGERLSEIHAPGSSPLIDLGGGRALQALVEDSGDALQMHLTFFDAKGHGLKVSSLSVTGTSSSGDAVIIPVHRFEPAHYAATLELEPGHWEFDVEGVTPNGGDFTARFQARIP